MDIFNLLKSWIPWRSERANLSRSFWMPDHSCLVCYNCDSQFTLFNRKHHCRNCGRVFCNKCSQNRIPALADERNPDWEIKEKIRVCNFCFKQWEQSTINNENNESNNSPSSVSTRSSIISSTSAATAESSGCAYASMVHSEDSYSDQQNHSSFCSTHQSLEMETNANTERSKGHVADEGNLSTQEDGSDDEEGVEDGDYQFDPKRSDYCEADVYYTQSEFYGIDTGFKMRKVHSDEGNGDDKCVSSSSVRNSSDSGDSGRFNQLAENDIGTGNDAPFSIAPAEEDVEPVDFENNGLLWLPPEPIDEEDEEDSLLSDAYGDDDNADDEMNRTGEWGNYCSSSSFGSGENRVEERSNGDHKNAVKNVVDGHFKSLIAQLLQLENLPLGEEEDQESWLDIVTSLSCEAATLLKPDMSTSGGMDPGGYVKVKCIATGYPSQSTVIKGVVCKKNVAHRRMASKMKKPRLLILGGALEYQRVSNLLSSFDTLLQQEMDHLKMAVAKIDAHQPDILLVEKSVSRYAQDYLLERDISLVLNIKKPLLERIARCTGAEIVPSVDHLLSPKLGYCDFFHLDSFLEEHGTAGQRGRKLIKTLMYFEGCPKPLGYTILLRGASIDELKKVKHVVQYGVFAAYHLALETSFLADEGASLPELPFNFPITVALPDKPLSIVRSISTVPDIILPASEQTPGTQPVGEPLRSKSVPVTDLISLIPSLSPYHAFEDKSRRRLNDSLDEKINITYGVEDVINQITDGGYTAHDNTSNVCADRVASSEPQINHQGDLEPASVKEDFPPSLSDHQSILVTLSSRCVWKGTVCERSQLFRIKYYGNFDKPLGRFLRDHLFDQGYRCRSCDMPAEAHVQCYTHQQGTLTISVKKLPEFLLSGEMKGNIWMWHRCLRCPKVNGFPPATQRIVMSDAAWGLSFGKFLELSFSNHAAASRVASCGHSLHRDCLRFYGFGKMVACFRYASINVHSVRLPPSKLDFNYDNQEWIQHEVNEVVDRAELLFAEVLNALGQMDEKISGSQPLESGAKVSTSRQQIAGLEARLQKEKAEFEETLHKILNSEEKKDHPVMDIFEINRLRRQLLFQSYIWDQHLIRAAKLGIEAQGDLSDTKVVQVDRLSFPANLVYMNEPIKPSKLETVFEKAEQDGHDCGQETDIDANQLQPTHEKNRLESGTEHGEEGQDNHFSGKNNDVEFEQSSLSDTLEAAWTGGSLSVTVPKAELSSLSESTGKESSTEVVEMEKLGFEEHRNDKKGSVHTEDSGMWLGKSFISFYQSLNKGVSGGTQKLDMFEYDPVYMSSFLGLELRDGARLLLPVGINDTVIPIYDDEATSIISYALCSPDYISQLSDHGKLKDMEESAVPLQSVDSLTLQSLYSCDKMALESYSSFGSLEDSMASTSGSRSSMAFDHPISRTKTLHAKVFFSDKGPLGKVKYTVTCYFAQQFEALRRICCPSEMDFVRSLSRCRKWGAQGGKSNVFFAKTLDDRFIIKQVTKTELESFIKFAPSYFQHLTHSISTKSPTCLAKILGMYQVTSKHRKGGKEWKMDVLVMENLMFGRKLTRLYDLKGSTRSRYNPDSSGNNKVLLDQNLVEAMPTCPIFVGNKAKRLLERGVWNDTGFLASIDVMDYSLLVGVDEEKNELVIGIIDFMRQYTWDKHLETWVKTSGILGGPKNVSPTVISPKQYKKRFRKAMTTYFLMVPDQWSPPTIASSKSQTDISEEKN